MRRGYRRRQGVGVTAPERRLARTADRGDRPPILACARAPDRAAFLSPVARRPRRPAGRGRRRRRGAVARPPRRAPPRARAPAPRVGRRTAGTRPRGRAAARARRRAGARPVGREAHRRRGGRGAARGRRRGPALAPRGARDRRWWWAATCSPARRRCSRACWATASPTSTSVRLMEHAATLDLAQFEDPAFYDQLERARRQTTGRVGLFAQLLGHGAGRAHARVARRHARRLRRAAARPARRLGGARRARRGALRGARLLAALPLDPRAAPARLPALRGGERPHGQGGAALRARAVAGGALQGARRPLRRRQPAAGGAARRRRRGARPVRHRRLLRPPTRSCSRPRRPGGCR
jgi:hypothetical protein